MRIADLKFSVVETRPARRRFGLPRSAFREALEETARTGQALYVDNVENMEEFHSAMCGFRTALKHLGLRVNVRGNGHGAYVWAEPLTPPDAHSEETRV